MTAYRDDVAALAARHQALATEVADKTRELVETARVLEEVQARARLPVLDNIRIASPCTADWTQMTGDERVRACGLCNKNVFNLSELTRAQAQALIVEQAGDLCARYYQRQDGTILLKDCEVGVSRNRRRRVVAAGAMALLGGGAAWAALAKPSEPELASCDNVYVMQGGATAEPDPMPAPEVLLVPELTPEPTQEAPAPAPEEVEAAPTPVEPDRARPALKMGKISMPHDDFDL